MLRDADEARKWFEAQRWPHGVICPHCGNFDQIKITPLQGKSYRSGLYYCVECRHQFTVTVGTPMHRSKIPLNKWLIAMHLISASENGVSARELQDALGIAYHSSWHLSRRVRQFMSGCTRSD
jgi:transposase-like protein